MSRVAAAIAAVLWLAAPGARTPEPSFTMTFAVPSDEVAFGVAFPLTVVRGWTTDLEPERWREDALAPLVVRIEAVERRAEGRRIEETRRYRAFAFDRDATVVPPRAFRAHPVSGGPPRIATSPEIRLRVRSGLDPARPGPVEPPGPIPRPRSRWPLLAALAMAAALGGVVWLRAARRAARAAGPEPVRAPAPRERALARLAALRARAPESPPDVDAWHVEAADLVRDFLDGAFGLRTKTMTTEEILESTGVAVCLGPRAAGAVPSVLRPCDLVKFARRRPPAPERILIAAAIDEIVTAAERTEEVRDR